MADLLSPLKALAGKFYTDPARMLIITSAAGWILSSAAQIAAIGFNRKIPAKEKSFLIPQEACDGLVNVGLFVTFSAAAKKMATKAIEKNFIEIKNPTQYKAPILTLVSIFSGAVASNVITPYVRNYLGAKMQKRIIDNRLNPPEAPKKPITPLLFTDSTKPLNHKFIYPTSMQTSLKI